jgi:hypothetical protein
MAQQITIDIVAETKKLTAGINEANDQLGGMSKNLKAAGAAAAGLASAFVLKQGISFLKDGIEEAKDARTAMIAATSAFGKGSKAIQEITKDAEKFGKELAVDNDDIIKLATSIGVKLPNEAKGASAELVLLSKNLEATSGGSIKAEATLSKLGKAFADGELSAKELSKAVPGLDAATLKMVETLSKAGKNQEALNVLIEAGEKKYGGAAAAQVTATQKFDVALADLKETIGTKVLPILEKLIDLATKMIDAFSAQPKILQNVELALLGIVAVGGPLLGFLASAKTAMVTLGLVSEGAAVGTNILSVALKAIPILAVIALVVLLVANWDTISAKAKEVAEAVTKWFGKIYEDIKEFAGKAIDWLKENWPLLLGVLTGPFGLFVAWLVTHKEELINKFKEIWTAIKDNTIGFVKKFTDAIMDQFWSFDTEINRFWYEFTDSLQEIWKNIKWVIKALVANTINEFGVVFQAMIEVGQNIARGIWQGLSSMTNWFKLLLTGWVNANIPYAVRKILGIASPSKVMMGIGKNITEGLYIGMGLPGAPGINLPTINVGGAGAGAPINITINAGLGTDAYTLGREITTVLQKYGKISSRVV